MTIFMQLLALAWLMAGSAACGYAYRGRREAEKRRAPAQDDDLRTRFYRSEGQE